jgi:hypothetical protein
MFACAGTCAVQAGKAIHHVDNSWNEAWHLYQFGTDRRDGAALLPDP